MTLGWVTAGLLLLGGVLCALVEHAWQVDQRANRSEVHTLTGVGDPEKLDAQKEA